MNEQALQHFISQSPWSGSVLIEAIQAAVKERPELQSGTMLIVDESSEEREGEQSVGVSRQYLGRSGKVDQGQVGVFVSLVKEDFWTWLDGEWYVPEVWFSDDFSQRRTRAGLPEARCFATKTELGLQLVERARARGVPFEAVAFDTFYGRDGWFRATLADKQFEYRAEVPVTQRVYLTEPVIGLPTNKKGPPAEQPRVLSPKAKRVDQYRDQPDLPWQTVTSRPAERGFITADFLAQRVWTVWHDANQEFHPRQEWLVIRRGPNGCCSYALSNASAKTTLSVLAHRKCQRSFIEQANRDAKSEFGWDEIQTTNYRAWQHHLALTILAAWFIAETKLDWAIDFARDPALLTQYEVELLPALSVPNVRRLLLELVMNLEA